jgi:hypothetical protein
MEGIQDIKCSVQDSNLAHPSYKLLDALSLRQGVTFPYRALNIGPLTDSSVSHICTLTCLAQPNTWFHSVTIRYLERFIALTSVKQQIIPCLKCTTLFTVLVNILRDLAHYVDC